MQLPNQASPKPKQALAASATRTLAALISDSSLMAAGVVPWNGPTSTTLPPSKDHVSIQLPGSTRLPGSDAFAHLGAGALGAAGAALAGAAVGAAAGACSGSRVSAAGAAAAGAGFFAAPSLPTTAGLAGALAAAAAGPASATAPAGCGPSSVYVTVSSTPSTGISSGSASVAAASLWGMTTRARGPGTTAGSSGMVSSSGGAAACASRRRDAAGGGRQSATQLPTAPSSGWIGATCSVGTGRADSLIFAIIAGSVFGGLRAACPAAVQPKGTFFVPLGWNVGAA
jgi:hypothetical protein